MTLNEERNVIMAKTEKAPKLIRVAGKVYERLPSKIRTPDGKIYELDTSSVKAAAVKPGAEKTAAKKEDKKPAKAAKKAAKPAKK